MFERFTRDARATVVRAREHALRRKDPTVGPIHLLLALAEGRLSEVLSNHGIDTDTVERLAPGTSALTVDDDAALQSIGVDLNAIREAVESAFGPGALDSRSGSQRGWRPWRLGGGHKPFTADAKKALELSLREVIRLEAHEITSEALLLGLLRTGAPELSGILDSAAANSGSLRSELESRIRHAA